MSDDSTIDRNETLAVAIVASALPTRHPGQVNPKPTVARPNPVILHRMADERTDKMQLVISSTERLLVNHAWFAWFDASCVDDVDRRRASLRDVAETLGRLSDSSIGEQILRAQWEESNAALRNAFEFVLSECREASSLFTAWRRFKVVSALESNMDSNAISKLNRRNHTSVEDRTSELNTDECPETAPSPDLIVVTRQPMVIKKVKTYRRVWQNALCLTVITIMFTSMLAYTYGPNVIEDLVVLLGRRSKPPIPSERRSELYSSRKANSDRDTVRPGQRIALEASLPGEFADSYVMLIDPHSGKRIQMDGLPLKIAGTFPTINVQFGQEEGWAFVVVVVSNRSLAILDDAEQWLTAEVLNDLQRLGDSDPRMVLSEAMATRVKFQFEVFVNSFHVLNRTTSTSSQSNYHEGEMNEVGNPDKTRDEKKTKK